VSAALPDPITDDDLALIIRSVVEQAGPDGIEEDEAEQQVTLIANHVRRWKTARAMYEAFAAQKIRLALTDDESDVKLISTKECP